MEKKEEAAHVKEGKVNEEEYNEQEVKDVFCQMMLEEIDSAAEKKIDDKLEMMFT